MLVERPFKMSKVPARMDQRMRLCAPGTILRGELCLYGVLILSSHDELAAEGVDG